MKIKKLLVIPDIKQIDEYLELAERYNLGFEYNDFFLPQILDDEAVLDDRKTSYKNLLKLPDYCTMHGAFLDITVFSDDRLIKQASDYRVEQSLSLAEELGVKGVIFHTNYIANFRTESYRTQFVKKNAEYWGRKADEHKNLNIYIENMFDDTPELLAQLAEALSDKENIGVCFDYAHAHVFGNPDETEEWVRSLAPYIRHVHINDNDFKQDLHLAVGDGRTDWKKFKFFYENYFPEATVLIEVRGIDKIRKSLDYLSEL